MNTISSGAAVVLAVCLFGASAFGQSIVVYSPVVPTYTYAPTTVYSPVEPAIPTVTYYPTTTYPTTTYYAPTTAYYAPTTTYNAPPMAYYPAATTTYLAPAVAPTTPLPVAPSRFVPGEPVRNLLRAIF